MVDMVKGELLYINKHARKLWPEVEAAGSLSNLLKSDAYEELKMRVTQDGFYISDGLHFKLDGNTVDHLNLHVFPLKDGHYVFQFNRDAQQRNTSTANALILTCDEKGNLKGFNGLVEKVCERVNIQSQINQPVVGLFDGNYHRTIQKLIKATQMNAGYLHTEAYFDAAVCCSERLLVQGAPSGMEGRGFNLIIHLLDAQLERALAEEQVRANLAEEINHVLKLEIKEHQATQKKLRDAERYANSIIDSSVDMIVSLDLDLLITEFNRSAENITGFKKESIYGKPVTELIECPNFQKDIISEVRQKGFWEGQITISKHNGGVCTVWMSIGKLKSGERKALGFVLSMRDISAEAEANKIAKEQQAKIKAIFNSGSIMFWTVNRNTALTSFNLEYAEAIKRMYGKYPKVNKDLNKPKEYFASDEYHDFWYGKYQEVFESGNKIYFQTQTRNQNGKHVYREIFLSPIRDVNTNEVVEVAGMAIDITEKKQVEREMNAQSAKIQAIFNASNHMIWSVDPSMQLTFFNEVFQKRSLSRYGVNPVLNMDTLRYISLCGQPSIEKWKERYKLVLRGEKLQFEEVLIDREGREHLEEVLLSPIRNQEGEVIEIAAISQTVTFKRAAERKLKEQAAKISAIFDSTAMLIWTVDRDMRIRSFNKIFAEQHFRLLGKDVGIGDDFVKGIAPHAAPKRMDDLRSFFNKAFKGKKQQFEGILYSKDGSKRWMQVFLNPIFRDDQGIHEISCLSYEITDKKEIQEQMLESIHEKEVLLQEVHHRVKNNLQVISSILNLQSSYVKDENSLNILRESQNRIKSMSFIHESLYQTRDFSKIEFGSYILSLTNSLIHSYSIGAGRIELKTKFQKVHLSLDQAIPCGLIVNELVSNALKYAFPDHQDGIITMELKEKSGKIYLSIGDNGIGLPKDLDVENSDSLGLQLVYTLAEQLDSHVELQDQKGTKFLITFDKR